MTDAGSAPNEGMDSLEGHYAGPVTRLLAFLADAFAITTTYGFILSGLYWAYDAITGSDVQPPVDADLWGFVGIVAGFVVWQFLYNGFCWSVWWKTPGMALLGIRVVQRDGSDLAGRVAWKRALFYPVSFSVPPLGFAGVVLGAERRAWHDMLAGTTVVYDWNARRAQWRLLARRGPTPTSGGA